MRRRWWRLEHQFAAGPAAVDGPAWAWLCSRRAAFGARWRSPRSRSPARCGTTAVDAAPQYSSNGVAADPLRLAGHLVAQHGSRAREDRRRRRLPRRSARGRQRRIAVVGRHRLRPAAAQLDAELQRHAHGRQPRLHARRRRQAPLPRQRRRSDGFRPERGVLRQRTPTTRPRRSTTAPSSSTRRSPSTRRATSFSDSSRPRPIPPAW